MSQDRLSRRAIQLISENRIQQAIEEGQFDNLPGTGKPIPDIDEPYDPMWWVKQWVRREKLGRELATFMKSSRRALVLLILCLLPAAAFASDVTLSTSGVSYFGPFGEGVALLPGGGYAAVWNWTILGGPYSDSDVRMQWIRPDSSRIFPKGHREVAGSSLAEEGGAVIAPHPRSGMFVAFSHGDDEVKTQVLVQRYDGTGRRLWPGVGVIAVSEQGRRNQSMPSLVPDAKGGVYVCFTSSPVDGVVSTAKILCQHLDANGRRLWPRYGIDPGGMPGMRSGSHGVTDGEGGLLLVWRNSRSYDADPQLTVLIEGQRFAPDGTRLWGRQGRLLRTTRQPARGAFFYYQPLQVVTDGEGGAIVALNEHVSLDEPRTDIVAQRVSRDGNPLWGSGVVVAGSPDEEGLTDLVPGPEGGAFLLFMDHGDRQVELAIHGLDEDGRSLWEERLSAPETYHINGFGAFDGDLLRVVWTRYTSSAPAQVRLLVLDLNGNPLDGPEGEILAEDSTALGFVYDPTRDQGFAVLSSTTNSNRITGLLFHGRD